MPLERRMLVVVGVGVEVEGEEEGVSSFVKSS